MAIAMIAPHSLDLMTAPGIIIWELSLLVNLVEGVTGASNVGKVSHQEVSADGKLLHSLCHRHCGCCGLFSLKPCQLKSYSDFYFCYVVRGRDDITIVILLWEWKVELQWNFLKMNIWLENERWDSFFVIVLELHAILDGHVPFLVGTSLSGIIFSAT